MPLWPFDFRVGCWNHGGKHDPYNVHWAGAVPLTLDRSGCKKRASFCKSIHEAANGPNATFSQQRSTRWSTRCKVESSAW